jgi:hypothetical protein
VAAIVCCHLISKTERCLGFVENNPDPSDLQAWCSDCENLYQVEQELSEAFREFNDFRVVCDFCYAAIKSKHSIPASQ